MRAEIDVTTGTQAGAPAGRPDCWTLELWGPTIGSEPPLWDWARLLSEACDAGCGAAQDN